MNQQQQRQKRSTTKRTKCRLTAMKKKTTLLKNTYPLFNESELLQRLKSQLEPEMEQELCQRMAQSSKNVCHQTAKRWDLLMEMMEENGILINIMWDLIVLKNTGNKDAKNPILEEYRKDVKKKCQTDLEHLRLSNRGKSEVANYVLLKLEEYQFDMTTVNSELDKIETCIQQIWCELGQDGVQTQVLPETENVEEVLAKLGDIMQKISMGIKEFSERNDVQEKLKELQNTIKELRMDLDQEKHVRGVIERDAERSRDENDKLKSKHGQLQRQHTDLQEKLNTLEREKQQDQLTREEIEKKLKRKQDQINDLTSANKTVIDGQKVLQREKQEQETQFQARMDRMEQYFRGAVSRMEQKVDDTVHAAVERVETRAKESSDKAINDIANAINNNKTKPKRHNDKVRGETPVSLNTNVQVAPSELKFDRYE